MATKIILFSIPFFFLLIFIELWFNKKEKAGVYRLNDALTSLSLGVISQTKVLVMFSLATMVYGWVSQSMVLTLMSPESVFTWIFSFVLYDFLYYWYHRTSHQVNFLWASHVVHHQSEEYNLTTALRQTSSSVMVWIFYIPSFILGIPAEVFFVSGALNLVYQFWVHTQLIGKLGWFEAIFVTPSHHRVHHGQNETYIDKNHGGVFIVWDRLFGTYQEELANEKVIYGVRRPVSSFNPIWANVHTWYSLFIDSVRTKKWFDKIRIWIMPTGWRPQDMIENFPLNKQAAGKQLKFDPKTNDKANYYALYQYVCSIIFGIIFILSSNVLVFKVQLLFWILITLPLLSNGFILEGKRFSFRFEISRLFLSILVVSFYRDYFDSSLMILLVSYFLLSLASAGLVKKKN